MCNEQKTLLDKCVKAQKKLVRKGTLVSRRETIASDDRPKCERFETS